MSRASPPSRVAAKITAAAMPRCDAGNAPYSRNESPRRCLAPIVSSGRRYNRRAIAARDKSTTNFTAAKRSGWRKFPRQPRYLGGDPPRSVARRQLGGRSADRFILEIKTRHRLTVLIADDETKRLLVNGPGRREAAAIEYAYDGALIT